MLGRRRSLPVVQTRRLILRLPEVADHSEWCRIRQDGEAFLRQWEPEWAADHFSRRAFRARVLWARRSRDQGRALPLFLIRRDDRQMLGAITLDNIRRGPAQAASVGYWIGPEYARAGYMREALDAVVVHAFSELDLGRIEAACLPRNQASRNLLELSGFNYEGVVKGYLRIRDTWCDHVLYARLRADRCAPDEQDN